MLKRFILASGSPRRKELLSLAGVQFEVRSPDVDESIIKNESPKAMVKRLSNEKALEVWRNLPDGRTDAFILAADTTVVSPDHRILGKPRDRKEAIRMITSLQGRPHRVLTGYALLQVSKGEVIKKVIRLVQTRVWIGSMGPKEVKAYVDRGESMDKAGAYAAQGFGMAMIEKISGSYTNVVGLPMTEVMRDLKRLGWKP